MFSSSERPAVSSAVISTPSQPTRSPAGQSGALSHSHLSNSLRSSCSYVSSLMPYRHSWRLCDESLAFLPFSVSLWHKRAGLS